MSRIVSAIVPPTRLERELELVLEIASEQTLIVMEFNDFARLNSDASQRLSSDK